MILARVAVIAAAVVTSAAAPAQPQSYPNRPIRMIVPFAPGGGTDVTARRIAQKLTLALNEQVIVDNRAGAGGTAGGEIAVRSLPDGYTLIFVSGSYAVNPSLHKLSYDPVKGITPIGLIGISADLAVTYPGLPVRTTRELIDYAKANPGKINYASSGVGGFTHLATVLFCMMTQTDMVHVPYKGTGPALADVMGGQSHLVLGGVASEVPHVRSGRLRAIGVTTPKRLPGLPDIPAIAETVPGYEAVLWYGMWGPPGMPRDIVTKLTSVIRTIVDTPENRDMLSKDGVEAEYMAPAQFGNFIASEVVKWAKVVKAGKVTAE